MTVYLRVFIVIDALDECQTSDDCQQRFLSGLFNLQTKCKTKLFVTSQLIASIKKKFERNSKLEICASEEDVQRYLEDHMNQLSKFVTQSLELQEKIKTGIVKTVDEMYVVYFKHWINHANLIRFLLAQLYLNFLTDKKSSKTIWAALENLATGFEAYNHTYENVMKQINSQIKD